MEKDLNISTELVPPEDKGSSLDARREKFLDLVQGGLSISDAAAQVGGNSTKFLRRGEIQEAIKDLIEAGHFRSDIVRETVKSATFAAFVKSAENAMKTMDPKDLKVMSELGGQIAGYPDIGLKAPPTVEIKIDTGSLSELMEVVKESDVYEVNIEESDSDTPTNK